jgi:pyridoxal phosphate enzyme (YggS family)
MSEIGARAEALRKRIETAARGAGRDPGDVKLLAISKTFPAERVLEATIAGLRSFGENRVQEAETKIPEVRGATDLRLDWHLVGQLQRNKARRAVELFDWIHSVDRPALASALERHAEALQRKPRILIQVNVDEEEQKAGVAPTELAQLAEQVRPSFARLRELLVQLNQGRAEEACLTELSMGMSADFEAAIREGATWVRVGSAIFGERVQG